MAGGRAAALRTLRWLVVADDPRGVVHQLRAHQGADR